MSSRAPTDGGPMMWAPGCRTEGRLVLKQFRFWTQLTLSLEGGAEILAALTAQQRIIFLPPAPAMAPGTRGLRLGGWVHRPLAGTRSPCLSSLLPRRGLARTRRSIPNSSSGRCPTKGAKRSPLRSLMLRSVDEHHDILEPRRSRSAIQRRDGRMPQQELGRLQGLRGGGISELQATAHLRPALRRWGRGCRLAPGMLASGGGAQPRPMMARGIAPGEPPSSNRRWPPAKGAAPMVAKVVRTPERGGADSWAHGPRGRRTPAGHFLHWSPQGKTHARGNLGDGLRP